MANAPPGTQMASLDIDAAFRRIPVMPAHKPYIVVQCHPGQFYIDHVVPFGITSGTGLQGAVMDAIVDILDARGWGPNKKWVDDLNSFRFPKGVGAERGTWVYAHTLEDIFRLAEELGIQWHLIKCTDYGYIGVYLGFSWDLPNKSVSLPEKKRLKYLTHVQEFLELAERGKRVDLQAAMVLSGSLTHITFMYPAGRAYLPNLCTFIASFKNKFAPRYPPHSVTPSSQTSGGGMRSSRFQASRGRRCREDRGGIWAYQSTLPQTGAWVSLPKEAGTHGAGWSHVMSGTRRAETLGRLR